MLAALACWGIAAAQIDGPAEYHIYPLKHKTAAEVEKLLAERLAPFGATTHLVADPKTNRILLHAPDEAQRIARQLIESVDHPPESQAASRPIVKSYPCDRSRLKEVADRLRSRFSDRGVRVGVDSHGGQLLVVAPRELHTTIARELAALAREGAAPAVAVASAAPSRWRERFVPIVHSKVEQIEPMLRHFIGPRLEVFQSAAADPVAYRFVANSGKRVELTVDRRRNGVMLSGHDSLLGEFERLIRTLDGLQQTTGKSVRVVPVRKADPAKVQQAVEAYRSGFLDGVRTGQQ